MEYPSKIPLGISAAEYCKRKADECNEKLEEAKKAPIREKYLPEILKEVHGAAQKGKYCYTYNFSGIDVRAAQTVASILNEPKFNFSTKIENQGPGYIIKIVIAW